MSQSNALRDPIFALVGARWLEGGRDPEKGIDCLGITLRCAELRGLQAPDVWAAIEREWKAGKRDVGAMLPDGWRRVVSWPKLEQDDVVILADRPGERVPTGIGFVHQGHVVTSLREPGVVAVPLERALRLVLQVLRPCLRVAPERYAFDEAPVCRYPGTVAAGDDKTIDTCRARFDKPLRFGGFPGVAP